MKHIFRYCLLMMLCLIGCCGSALAEKHYYASQISLLEGLSSYKIETIAEDADYNVWVGTINGLNKISGNEVRNYYLNLADSRILNNKVQTVVTDEVGNVYVLSNSLILKYSAEEDEFSPLMATNTGYHVSAIASFGKKLYYARKNVIYVYADGKAHRLVKLNNTTIIELIKQVDEETFILLTQRNEIILWNKKANTFKNLPISISDNLTTHPLLIDQYGRLWVANKNRKIEVHVYDKEKQEFHLVKVVKDAAFDKYELLSFVEMKRQKCMLVGTDGGGVKCVDLDHFTVSQFPMKRQNYLLRTCKELFIDQFDNIWAGTVRHGCVLMKESYINYYPSYATSLDDSDLSVITELCLGADSCIYISTDGNGVTRFDPKLKTFKHYEQTNREKIISLVKYDANHLLLYYYNSGLKLLNIHTGVVSNFTKIKNSKVPYKVKLSVNDDYVSILGKESFCFHLRNSAIQTYKAYGTSSMSGLTPINDSRYAFLRNQIYKLLPEQGIIAELYTSETEIVSASYNPAKKEILFADVDHVYRFSLVSRKVQLVKRFHDRISAIICCPYEQLFIGTNQGIYRMNLDTNECSSVRNSGDFPSDIYNTNSMKVVGDMVYAGGLKGLIELGVRFETVEDKSKVKIKSLKIDGEKQSLRHLSKEKKIVLPWNFQLLEIEIKRQGNVYGNENIDYLYIDGQYTLTDVVKGSVIQLKNLPSGLYKLRLSDSNRNSIEDSPELLIEIIVLKPWWNTHWGLFVIFMSIAFILMASVMWYSKVKKKRLYKALEHKEKMLMEQQIKFLMNVSHELRTPLTLILTPLKKLVEMSKDNSAYYGHVKFILFQAQNMRRLIDMFLDVRKLEKGNQKLVIHTVRINDWIRLCYEEFESEYHTRGIGLRLNLDDNVDAVDLDMERCKIILSNFLTNALKYSPANTETIISSTLMQDKVRISVSDCGKGLSQSDLDKVFERFYQDPNRVASFGIGLSYAKMIAQMHNGSIGAYNNESGGATFFFELPLSQEHLSQAIGYDQIYDFFSGKNRAIPIPAEQIDFSMGTYSVLVVDDNKDLINLLKNNLRIYFKNVYSAYNGEEAFRLVCEKTPDIVVSDVNMPLMDGFEMCKKIKTTLEVSHIPVILLTAYAEVDNSIVGYKMGADGYLAKPFDIDNLLSVIKNVLYNRECVKKKYQHATTPIDMQNLTFSNSDEKFLTHLNEIIEENLSDSELDLQFILDRMKMGRQLFQNKLKSVTDLTIKSYINKIRITHACLLFSEGELNISEVAYKSGFSSPSYFSTVFKQVMGSSPKEYIDERKNEK